MPYQAPGVDDDRLSWILAEVNKAQKTLDAKVQEAASLPDTEPSRLVRVQRLNQMKREVDTAFIDLDDQVSQWANADVGSFYRQGHDIAAATMGSGFSFTLPHRQALIAISNDAYNDVGTRLQQVRRGFGDKVELQKMYEGLDPAVIASLQEKSRSAVTQMLLTGEDPRKISKFLAQDLWRDGVQIIDAGGNHWNPEKYTRMLIRTKSANAYNAGSLNKYAEAGVRRVKVFDGMEDDPECAEANGQVWTLDYAMEHVIEHPNCRRAFAVEHGKGKVDRKNPSPLQVLFNESQAVLEAQKPRINETLLFLKAALNSPISYNLREFRRTGEIQISEFMVNFLSNALKEWLGEEVPYLDRFLTGFVAETTRSLDALVESYVDPVLVALNLIEQMPTRAQVVALQAAGGEANILRQFVTDLVFRIERAKLFPDSPMNAVTDRLQAISRGADDALTRLQPALDRGALGLVEWVAQELVQVVPGAAQKLAEHRYLGLVHDILLANVLEDVTGVRSVINRLLPEIRPTLESFRSFQSTGVLRLPPGLVDVMASQAQLLVGKRFPEVSDFVRQVFLNETTVQRFLSTGGVPSSLANFLAREVGHLVPERFPEVERFLRQALVNPALVKGISRGLIPNDLVELAAREAFDLLGDRIPSIGQIVRQVLKSPTTISEFKTTGRLPYGLVELMVEGISKVDRLAEFSGVFREVLSQPSILNRIKEGVVPNSLVDLVGREIQKRFGEKIPNIGRIVREVLKSPQWVDQVRLGGRLPYEVTELLVEELRRVVPDDAANFVRRVLELTDTHSTQVSPLDQIRNFYETGTLPFTSTLAQLVETGVSKQIDDYLNPVSRVYLRSTIRESANLLARWIESYIDPVLVSAQLIKAMPSQAEVLALTPNPNKIRRFLRKWADQLSAAEELEDTIPAIRGFRALRDRVETLAEKAEAIFAPAALVFALGMEVKEQGVLGLVKFMGEFVGDAPYGQVAGELLNMASRGEFDDLQRSWKAAEAYIQSMNDLREEFHLSLFEEYQDVVEELRQITEARRQISQMLIAPQGSQLLPPGKDPWDRYWTTLGFTQMPLSLRKYLGRDLLITRGQLEDLDARLFRMEIDVYGKALELRYAGSGTNPRLYPFPQAFGADFRYEAGMLWDDLQLRDGARKLMDDLDNLRSTPVYDIELFREGGEALTRLVELDDPDIIESLWEQVSNGMLPNEYVHWLNGRRLKNATIQTLVDYKAVQVIVDPDGRSLITSVDPKNLLRAVGDQLARFDFDAANSRVLWDGDLVSPTTAVTQLELLQTFTKDIWSHAGSLMNDHPTIFADIRPRLLSTNGPELQRQWIQGFNPQGATRLANIRDVVPVDTSNLERALFAKYPGRVTKITGGFNGDNFLIKLPDGTRLFVKTFDGGGVSGSKWTGSAGQILASYMGSALEGAEVQATRVFATTDGRFFGLVHPGLEDADKFSDAWRRGWRPDLEQVRKHTMMDFLTKESDPNGGNYVVDRVTGVMVSIDSEASFFSSWGGAADSYHAREYKLQILSDIMKDDGNPKAYIPQPVLIRLTQDERDWLESVHDTYTMGTGSVHRTGKLPIGETDNGEIVLVGNVLGRRSVPGSQESFWEPALFLTQRELDWVTLPDDEKVARFTEALVDAYRDLPQGQIDELILQFGVPGQPNDLESVAAYLAGRAVTAQRAELIRMVDDGFIDIGGGVNSYFNPRTGLLAKVGEPISYVNPQGQIRHGTVLRVYEDLNGEMKAHVALGIGHGMTFRELSGINEPFALLNLSDARFVPTDPPDLTTLGRILEEFVVEPTYLDDYDQLLTRSAVVFEDAGHGIFKPTRVQNVAIDVEVGGLGDFVWRRDGTLVQGAYPFEVVEELRLAVARKVDAFFPTDRPLRVVVTTHGFEMADGRRALGYFDTETRTAYVSAQALFDGASLDEMGRLIFEDYGELRNLMDFSLFERILDHELSHATVISRELQFRTRKAKEVIDQMLLQNPDLSAEADWAAWAEFQLNELGLTQLLGTDDPLRTLVEWKVSILEDVQNSKKVKTAWELAQHGMPDEIAPDVVAAILRGEPEAHHELAAEVLSQTEGGVVTRWVYRHREFWGHLSDSEFERDIVKPFQELTAVDTIGSSLPGWRWRDVDLAHFINDQLDDGGIDGYRWLTPRQRTPNRRYWQEKAIPTERLIGKVGEPGDRFAFDTTLEQFEQAGVTVHLKENDDLVTGWTSLDDDAQRRILLEYKAKHAEILRDVDWKLVAWVDEQGTLHLETVKLFPDRISAVTWGFAHDADMAVDLGAVTRKDLGNAFVPLRAEFETIDDWAEAEDLTRLREELMDVLRPKTKSRSTVETLNGVPPPLTLEAIPEHALVHSGPDKGMTLRDKFWKDYDRVKIVRSDGTEVDKSREAIKRRFTQVLERAEQEYASRPGLRQKHQFYLHWNTVLRAEAAKGNIEFNRAVAATAIISGRLNAEQNLPIGLHMIDTLITDAPLSGPYHGVTDIVEDLKEYFHFQAERWEVFKQEVIDDGREHLVPARQRDIDQFNAWADQMHDGIRLSDMEDELAFRVMNRLRQIENGSVTPRDTEGAAKRAAKRPPGWGAGYPTQNRADYLKAIAVLRGTIPVPDALGDTKYRSFYNNILDPFNLLGIGDVTSDFHMGDAAFFITSNQGNDLKGDGWGKIDGLIGGYRVIISDIIRELFDEGWGLRVDALSPAQMQEVIWAIWKEGRDLGWFGDLNDLGELIPILPAKEIVEKLT